MLLVTATHSAWLVWRWGDPRDAVAYSDWHYFGVTATSTLLVFASWRSSTGRTRTALKLLLLSFLCRLCADGTWLYLELFTDTSPFPSVADVAYLASYPLMGMAVLAFVRRDLRPYEWVRLVLDSAIVVSAVGLLLWRGFVSDIALDASKPLLEREVSLAYPALDLLLLGVLTLLVFRQKRFTRFEVLLGLGVLLEVVGDLAFAYLTHLDVYTTGHLIDATWTWGMALLAFGARFALVEDAPAATAAESERTRSTMRQAFVASSPYAAILLAFSLLLANVPDPSVEARGIVWGTALVTLLVALRQGVAVTDNAILARELTRRSEALQRSRERLAHQANHDPLTQLPNRSHLLTLLDQAMRTASASGRILAVLFVDMDDFKVVNDTLGHAAGDELLREVAKRLSDAPSHVVARLGGDEFVVVLECATEAEAERAANDVLDALGAPLFVRGQRLYPSASVGFSLFPRDASTPAELLSQADAAMYQVKREGRGDVRAYSPSASSRPSERLEIEAHLHGALDRGEFSLHYQPQVDTLSQRVVGAEALLRWHNEHLGHVAPSRFVAICEDTGLIVPIGRWVLREVCRQQAQWRARGLFVPVAVNISPVQFARADFVDVVRSALDEFSLPGESVHLEITERLVIRDLAACARQFEQLRELGIQVAVDDFGTGVSGVSALLHLPVSTLKIDRSFVKRLTETDEALRAVTAITALARSLRLAVVAEGVETLSQQEAVARLGVEFTQGYLSGKPMTPSDFEAFVENSPTDGPGFTRSSSLR